MISVFLGVSTACCPATPIELTFHGTADLSAAVFVDNEHFVVADDESNILRMYRTDDTGKPVSMLDLNAFLQPDPENPEADIEAAARVGNTIYWITSHGRNMNGKMRLSRYRFFATEIKYEDTGSNRTFPDLIPIGFPCSTLIDQFLTQAAAAQLDIQSAVQKNRDLSKKEEEKLAPKNMGLNIEAMAVLQESGTLLIGLRNPLFTTAKNGSKKAILFELLNPQDVIEGKVARFGRILFWELGSRGLRSLEYDSYQRRFYLIAGAVDSETTSALFIWDGKEDHFPRKIFEWHESEPALTPEAIAIHPHQRTLWIFSDDGSLEIPVETPTDCQDGELLESGKCPNKYLTNDLEKTFRVQIFEFNEAASIISNQGIFHGGKP